MSQEKSKKSSLLTKFKSFSFPQKPKTNTGKSTTPVASPTFKLFHKILAWLASPLLWLTKFLRKNWLWVLLLCLALAGYLFWNYQQRQAAKQNLTFVPVQRKDLVKTLELSGVVDAKEKAQLRFAIGGKLTYLGAKVGDAVTHNQTIAQIDRRELEKRLQQDLNSYVKERLDWDKLNADVFKNEYTTDEEYLIKKGQLDLNNEVLTVEIRDIAFRDTILAAPFGGILTKSPAITAGVQLMSSDAFEVVNPDTLLFKATVEEVDLALLQEGQQVEIELDAYPDEMLQTYIDYISYTSSQTTNATVFLVEMPLNQYQLGVQKFRLGLNGDARVKVNERKNTLVIPLAATRERDGITLVDVKTDENEYQERQVEIGLENDDELEVLSGLSENEQVLIPTE